MRKFNLNFKRSQEQTNPEFGCMAIISSPAQELNENERITLLWMSKVAFDHHLAGMETRRNIIWIVRKKLSGYKAYISELENKFGELYSL